MRDRSILGRQEVAAAAVAPPRSAGLDIVVADDNVDLAESFAEVLRLEGHHVTIANDGDEALSATARRVPDVAFLDGDMPSKNGHEVARLLRARAETRGIYLIAVTGWANRRTGRIPTGPASICMSSSRSSWAWCEILAGATESHRRPPEST